MQKIIEILQDLIEDVDFNTEDGLIDDEIIDSLDLVVLVGELNDAFGVEIGAQHLLPENFNSAKSIDALVKKLKEG